MSRADKWDLNLRAARAFHAREGHLDVPRRHVESVAGAEVNLGTFLDHAVRRWHTYDEQRRAQLEALGLRSRDQPDAAVIPGQASDFPQGVDAS